MSEKAQKLIKRYEALYGERQNWEWQWQEIADRISPNNADFNVTHSPGEKRMQKIFDSTGLHANNMLAAGLFSMLTSPSQKWFEMEPGDDRLASNPQVRVYLKEVTDIMLHELRKPKAGFNTAMHEMYLEYCAFGTASIFATEGEDKHLLFNCIPLREIFIAESAEGRVDTVFRKYTYTVRQMAQKFGVKALSEDCQKLFADGKYDKKVDVLHVVMPRADAKRDSLLAVDKPIASIFMEVKQKHILKETGYDEMPIFVPRFYKGPTEKYGRSPGTDALPWVKELQTVKKSVTKIIQKKADPPLMAPDDGFINPVNTTPGGLNFYRAGTDPKDRIQPFGNDGEVNSAVEYLNDTRQQIREMFFMDQLQLQQGPQMTATEVLQRVEEKLRLMGPVLGRIQTELLDPMIDRMFGVLMRSGKFSEAPEELRGQELKVTYTSPIARAQEQLEANGLVRSLDILMPLMDRKPEMMGKFDTDSITEGVFNMFSVSPKFLVDQETVEAQRAQEAEMVEAERTAPVLQQAGQGAASIAGIQQQGE
ncbi:MAG: hypothetical protein DRP45_00920 [Candidatus Zixiibacteriota bacterium]|nr:MAG: hypothetical protein DRP45_00920 [candidate division Zixibacteria bacterium]